MALTTYDKPNVIKVTGTTAATTTIFSDKRHIVSLYWYRPTAQAHLLHVIKGSGKPLAEFYSHSANYSQNLPLGGIPVTGMKVTDMDSGTLYIYYFKEGNP